MIKLVSQIQTLQKQILYVLEYKCHGSNNVTLTGTHHNIDFEFRKQKDEHIILFISLESHLLFIYLERYLLFFLTGSVTIFTYKL